jgi:DNA polymerase III alpha subunit
LHLSGGTDSLAPLSGGRDMTGQPDFFDVDERSATLPLGKRNQLAGLVLTRQRPGTFKGGVFITTEDEHENANLIAFTDIIGRSRAALIHPRRLLVKERIEPQAKQMEMPLSHLIAKALTGQTNLLRCAGRRSAYESRCGW